MDEAAINTGVQVSVWMASPAFTSSELRPLDARVSLNSGALDRCPPPPREGGDDGLLPLLVPELSLGPAGGRG